MGARLIAMLSCQDVSRFIASGRMETAGWRRRLSIRLHLLMCRHCRRYSRQIEAIGGAARRLLGRDQLDPGSHERLRSSILQQLSGAPDDESNPRV